MTEATPQAFVSDEQVRAHGWQTFARFFAQLKFLRKVLIPALVMMVLAAGAPSLYRWYVGKLSVCLSAQTCVIGAPTAFFGVTLPLDLTTLAFLTSMAIILRVVSWAFFEVAGQMSTQDLHADIIKSLASTRTTYFDEHPSGRLINRIVSDFDNVRLDAIVRAGDTANALIEVFFAVGLVWVSSPPAALLAVPIIAAFFYIQHHVAPMLSHAAALSSISAGRFLHRLTDLIEGRQIFLLYGRERGLLTHLAHALHERFVAQRTSARISGWLHFWTGTLAEVYGCVVLLALAFLLARGRIDATFAGVIISAIFSFSSLFNWLTLSASAMQESLAQVGRLFELVDLPSEVSQERAIALQDNETERETERETKIASSTHSLQGDIVFEQYSMSYRPSSPLVLNGLSLVLPHSKRTGIIGRTGAGKSSLIQALFRMVHVHEGDVRIGPRSIYDVDIHTLRAHFGVVPQQPYLFAGTVRSNLDRFGQYTEDSLARALRQVGLDFSLNSPVGEGGQNLSLGERQLISLARVLVAGRKIILMDEPTSSVDAETDARMSHVLHTAMQGKTVITIAHRLETLGNYDWIVEMGAGKVIRTGRPADILANFQASPP